ncbi:DNA polymerase I [Rarobacter incanus]|uniref:DNA polymerase I n=1 Tax=Rarobacter incanus TaxID=153494 RepID=A0A542SN60_9MICO|nr:DNA polymerase I [Rarobacter incanus]
MTHEMRPKLLLIDGHSMAFRAFFALPVENFTTTTGVATNAVYGFVSMLISLIKEENPTHVCVAFDAPGPTFRTEQYPEYKGTREKTPEDFKHQIPLIAEVLHAMGITTLEKPVIEADDILATLASQGSEAGMDVLVCSGDRDTLQLVTQHVTVLYPRRGVSDLARMTPQAVREKYGVAPVNYPDIAALVGETSDNLPGVPGVGPKTAAKWITQFGDLDNLLAHADDIKGKVGESLRAHLQDVRRNRRLNRLLTDVELPAAVTDVTRKPWDRPELDRLFESLQFRTLRDRLNTIAVAGDDAPAQASGAAIGAQIVDNESISLAQWLGEEAAPFGLAIDGRGTPVNADAWSVAVGRADGEAVVVNLEESDPDQDASLRAWLADPAAPKVTHGIKWIDHALAARGMTLAGVTFDTELAEYLSRPDQRSYDLASIVETHLHVTIDSVDESGQGALDFDDGGANVGLASQSVAIARLAAQQGAQLADAHESALLADLELPVAEMLARMERAGVSVDIDLLRGLDEDFAATAAQCAQEAYDVIGHTVNLGSPKQLQEVLFGELDMPKTKKIKTGYTTDAAALAELFAKTQHPFLEHLLAYRDATKLRQTVQGLLKAVAADGKIHTTFQQTVAATGRLSSTEPNLQNIPVRTQAGRAIRRAFVAGSDFETLVTADYSQIEMRIMAHLSGDDALIEAFRSGEDLHNFVGSRVFGVSVDAVTPAMRSKIKAMSYGLAYGLSAFGLSKQLNIEVSEARSLMADYFERFGAVRDYLHRVVEEARQTGYTETILGRRRYLPDLNSDNRQRREMAERMALNAPIQGSAADIIKVAMLQVDRAINDLGIHSRVLLQIHDELVVEVAPGETEQVTKILREQMGSAASLSVPLDVSVGVGHSWFDAGH